MTLYKSTIPELRYLQRIYKRLNFHLAVDLKCRSQWPRGLRRRSSAARLLRMWVRIPPEAWLFVCCEYCVLSRRSLCDGLITRPEESYQLWRVVVCDQETSKTRRLKPTTYLGVLGFSTHSRLLFSSEYFDYKIFIHEKCL